MANKRTHKYRRPNLFQVSSNVAPVKATAVPNSLPPQPVVSSICSNKDNVYYVLISNPSLGYVLLPNLCYNVKVIRYSNKWQMQTGGYRCRSGETAKVSTCFGYNLSIQFFPVNDSSVMEPADFDLAKNELGEKYGQFMSFNESNLLLGQWILLRVEVDQLAVCQYKLVLEYLLKSSANTTANQRIDHLWGLSSQQSMQPIVKVDSLYSELANRMDTIYDSLNITKSDIILVCGASNSGKSSLVHHLINRYISRRPASSAYYLECDPGQTEFAPCGILSLVTVDGQILSSPGFKFLSANQVSLLTLEGKIVSKIFGTITPSDFGSKYINLIMQLLEHFQKSPTNPLFINTVGWIEDLGLEILTSILKRISAIVSRTGQRFDKTIHVVRIQNTNEDFISNGLRRLDQVRIKKNLCPPDINSLLELRSKLHFELWYAPSCVCDNYKWSPFKTSNMRREINQLAYLTSSLWPDISYLSLYSLQPTKISLSNLCIHVLNNPRIASYLIFDLLNASWVMLGSMDEADFSRLKPDASSVADSSVTLIREVPPSTTCFGCGVVRTIDCRENCIYILTPRDLANWHRAKPEALNLLVLPDLISIPSGLLNEQILNTSSTSLPYIFSCFEPK